MTRKDFERIAAVIKQNIDRYPENSARFSVRQGRATLEILTINMAQSLAETNSRFKRDVFFKACGLDY